MCADYRLIPTVLLFLLSSSNSHRREIKTVVQIWMFCCLVYVYHYKLIVLSSTLLSGYFAHAYGFSGKI